MTFLTKRRGGAFLRALAFFLTVTLLLSGCRQQAASSSEATLVGGSLKRSAVSSTELQFTTPSPEDVFVTLSTDKGDIRFVLYPQYAPLAVENFCTLATQGYYDGTAFHRVVKNFVAQGGDASGTGLSGQSAWGSPFATERSDFLHHYSGALCMAAADGQPDTHLSQFYIVATPQDTPDEAGLAKVAAAGARDAVVDAYRQAGGAPYLDNTDTVFGQVVDGMDVVDRIAAASVEEDGTTPKSPVVVQGVTVENYTTLAVKGRPVYTPPQLEEQPTEIAGGEEALPEDQPDGEE